jgi:hypothetical protein
MPPVHESRLIPDISKLVKEGVTSWLASGTCAPFAGLCCGLIAGLIAVLFTQDGLYRTIAEIILVGVLSGVVTITIFDHIQDINNDIVLLFRLFSVAFLILVCPLILLVIIVLVENRTLSSAIMGDYGSAVMVGVISGAAVTILCDTTVATTVVRVAEDYTHILLIASVIFQGLFGIYNILSIMATTVGAAIYIGIIGRVLGSSSELINKDMIRTVSTTTAFGAFIGASIGAHTGIAIISGAIIGSIIAGAIISEADPDSHSIPGELLNVLDLIEPHSKSIEVIGLFIWAAVIILGPIATIIINGIKIGFEFITIITSTSKRTAVFRIIGGIIGAAIGAHAGVIGGACIGVIVTGLTIGALTGGAIIIKSLLSESGFHQQIDASTLKSIGAVVDITVLFFFAGIVSTVILSRVSYFIISALIGSHISFFIGNISEAITGDLNIASSGITGGLIGGIAVGIYRTKDLVHFNEFEIICALGAIGVITGFITTRVDEAIGNALLTKVGIPVGGIALGAFSGLLGGAFIVIFIFNLKVPNSVIGGFIGGVIGGYFLFSVIFTGLLGIAFSLTSMVLLTAVIIVRQITDICIPLNDIITNF